MQLVHNKDIHLLHEAATWLICKGRKAKTIEDLRDLCDRRNLWGGNFRIEEKTKRQNIGIRRTRFQIVALYATVLSGNALNSNKLSITTE